MITAKVLTWDVGVFDGTSHQIQVKVVDSRGDLEDGFAEDVYTTIVTALQGASYNLVDLVKTTTVHDQTDA